MKVFWNHERRRKALFLFVMLCWWGWAGTLLAAPQRVGRLEGVPAVPQKAIWDRFKILVWQYHTDVLRDFPLYRKAGLGGFHIDRGAGRTRYVEFSLEKAFPYYVDHVADKGFLYLKGNDVSAVTGKHGLVSRPNSLALPETLEKMKEHIARNVKTTRKGRVLAYAFDDEISLGSFVIPCDVDIQPASLAWFREWLRDRYGTIQALNREWDTAFKDFSEAMPKGFEMVRRQLRQRPISDWNLSPWMDFRQFMDYQFAAVLADLVRFANKIDPGTPAGFAGGQGPGPWGGYDYALLSRAVQWMENYNIHASDEILRSWWNEDRRPRMKTFFSTKNPKRDAWFLWFMLLHGNQAVIAWPDGWFHAADKNIAPHIKALHETLVQVQGEVSKPLVDPMARFVTDPIGIYYSHPSIQAGWAMDAVTHGKTWPNRKGSIDNENQTLGVLRKVWCKTFEDLSYQYDFVSYLDVLEDRIDLSNRFKVIVLPRVTCLSGKEAYALKRFVNEGGVLVTDSLCGVLDEHGKGLPKGVLDDLFGIVRDLDAGILNGKGITEIDGEKYKKPFLSRFTYYDGAYRNKGIVVYERGTTQLIAHSSKLIGGADGGGQASSLPRARLADDRGRTTDDSRSEVSGERAGAVLVRKETGRGHTVYLNLSPLEYWAPEKRFGTYGHNWRKIVQRILLDAGLKPRVLVYEKGNRDNMIEAIFWKRGGNHYLGLVKNPGLDPARERIAGLNSVEGVTGNPVSITVEFPDTVRLYNLRTGEDLGTGRVFEDRFKPWEANLYEVVY